MRDPKGSLLAPQQRTQRAGHLVASALALALLDKGWQLEISPGQFYFHRGTEKTNVFAMMDTLLTGKVTQQAWVTSCAEVGISDSLLVPSGTVMPAGPH